MSFGNFSSYLAKKNCQQQNYCCLQGPSGERGPEGAKGDTGPMGPGVPNENFVFGLTARTIDLSGQDYWLVPGGQMTSSPTPATPLPPNTPGPPPSPPPVLPVAYSQADISWCAIHINIGGDGDYSYTFTFKIYAVCDGDPPRPTTTVIVENVKTSHCKCHNFSTFTVGCDPRLGLAVSVSSSYPVQPPVNFSLTLYSKSPLNAP